MATTVFGAIVTALPNAAQQAIDADLGMTQAEGELTWTLTFAALASFIVVAGQLSDRIGRVRVYLIGSFALVISLIAGGLAWGGSFFLLMRVAQGGCLALVFAPATGVVNVIFTDARRRGVAFGIFGLAFGLGLGLGPVLGAIFSDWRWGFFFVAVVVAFLAFGTWLTTPLDTGVAERTVDVVGGVLFVVALSLMIVAIDQGRTWGWITTSAAPVLAAWTWPFDVSVVAVMLLASAVLFVVLYLYERRLRRRDGDPLIEARYFEIESYSLGVIVASLFFFGMLPLFVVLPLVSQILLEQDPLAMSLTVAPLGLLAAVGGLLSVPLGARFGSKWTVFFGMAALAVTTAAMVPVVRQDVTVAGLAFGCAVIGVANGIAYTRVTELTLVDVPPQASAHAAGLMFGARSTAGALGSVFLVAVVTVVVVHATPLLSQAHSESERIEATIVAKAAAASHPASTSSGQAGRTIAEAAATSPILESQKPSYIDGFRLSIGLSALAFAAGAVVALAAPDRRRT
jgi:MFS family permease